MDEKDEVLKQLLEILKMQTESREKETEYCSRQQTAHKNDRILYIAIIIVLIVSQFVCKMYDIHEAYNYDSFAITNETKTASSTSRGK